MRGKLEGYSFQKFLQWKPRLKTKSYFVLRVRRF